MSEKKGRVLNQDVAEHLKNTLMELLHDEQVVTLGLEINVKLASGYRDQAWFSWKHPRLTNTTSDSSSATTPTPGI